MIAIGALFSVLWPILWLLAIGTLVTVAQRFFYAYTEMARLDEADKRGVEQMARAESGVDVAVQEG